MINCWRSLILGAVLLSGCGVVGETPPEMSMVRLVLCGNDSNGKHNCYKFAKAIWGQISEENVRLERFTRERNPNIPPDLVDRFRPKSAKYIMLVDSPGCVTDVPQPLENHEIVAFEVLFSVDPADAQVTWQLEYVEPIDSVEFREKLISESRQKQAMIAEYGEGLTYTRIDCPRWQNRQEQLTGWELNNL